MHLKLVSMERSAGAFLQAIENRECSFFPKHMFKEAKQMLLEQNKIAKYLRYAMGEVLLIVIGILIAVSINNRNEAKRQKRILNEIFTALFDDIRQDTTEIGVILRFYKDKEDAFRAVLDGPYNDEKSVQCDICPGLISSRRLFSINQRGFQQLSDYKDLAASQNDTLVSYVLNFYVLMTGGVEDLNDLINQDVYSNLTNWRDHYPWFAAYLQGRMQDDSMNYFANSEDYRNRVALHHVLIYENYLPVLRSFKTSAELILSSLGERLSESQ